MTQFLNSITEGDCVVLMRSLPDNSVDLVIADPPYNLSKGRDWNWDRSEKLPGMGGQWSKVMETWDDRELVDLFEFTLAWLTEVKRVLKPEGSAWIFGTYHNSGVTNVACQLLGIEIINEVIWYKRNSFPNLSGRRLTASHETVLWCHAAKKGARKYYFDYEESRNGAYNYDALKAPTKQMRTVWDIPNNKEQRELHFGKHPTQKPLRVLKRMILLSSQPGDVVLAPFSGAGSECLAAKELGRDFIGFELDPEYVRLGRERLENARLSGRPQRDKSPSNSGRANLQAESDLLFEVDQ